MFEEYLTLAISAHGKEGDGVGQSGIGQCGGLGRPTITPKIGLSLMNPPPLPSFTHQDIDFVIFMQFLVILPKMSLPISRLLMGNPVRSGKFGTKIDPGLQIRITELGMHVRG